MRRKVPLPRKEQALSVPPFPGFLAQYIVIRDKGGTKFNPWPWQIELAEVLPETKRVVILKARQLGMTWIVAAYALWTAIRQRGAEVLLLSQNEREAKKFLSKVRFLYRRIPDSLRPRTGRVSMSELEFPDLDSVIEALPSTEGAGRGSTATLVICDEHSRHGHADENMASVDPTIEAGGQLISLSTAAGLDNLFATQCGFAAQKLGGWVEPRPGADGLHRFGGTLQAALEKVSEGGWLPVFLPYNAHPDRDAGWWDRQLEFFLGQTWKIHQEYPRDPEEAFVQTGRPVFDRDYLTKHRKLCVEPLPRSAWPAALAHCRAEELRIFTLPQPGRRYAAGVDVAEGLDTGDYSDLVLFEVDTRTEALSLHGHWPVDQFARLITVVAGIYPGLYAIERNNHGLAVILECRRLGLKGLYYERKVVDRLGKEIEPEKPGWLTTKVSKPLMIDELEVALRTFSVQLRDALALPEMTFYQNFPDGSTGAPVGQFDDRVISRAIAVQMLKRTRSVPAGAVGGSRPLVTGYRPR